MHPHVRTDLPDFLTPEVAEPAKEVLACHLKDITEVSSALDVMLTAPVAAPLISEVPGIRCGEGEMIKTFLLPGQAPKGERVR